MNNFKDLIVWQKSMDLATMVYRLCEKLPRHELYSLADQLKRAAVSVPSNIAEGQKRLNKAETIQFSGIALGSIAEVETQLLLVKRLYNLNVAEELELSEEITRMLSGLIKAIRSK